MGGAGLDVFVEEPPPADHPLVVHENVICTPHLGAATEQAQVNVAIAVAEQVRDYLLNGIVGNAVNVPSVSRELYEQIRPYVVLARSSAAFQGQTCSGSIEQIEIEYSGEAAELDVAPITVAVLKGLLESVTDQVNMVNAPVLAQQHGIKVVESKVEPHSQRLRQRDHHARGGLRRSLDRRAPSSTAVSRASCASTTSCWRRFPKADAVHLESRSARGRGNRGHRCSGEAGINISRMQLGLVPERGEAAMLVNIDRAPGTAVMETPARRPAT